MALDTCWTVSLIEGYIILISTTIIDLAISTKWEFQISLIRYEFSSKIQSRKKLNHLILIWRRLCNPHFNHYHWQTLLASATLKNPNCTFGASWQLKLESPLWLLKLLNKLTQQCSNSDWHLICSMKCNCILQNVVAQPFLFQSWQNFLLYLILHFLLMCTTNICLTVYQHHIQSFKFWQKRQ